MNPIPVDKIFCLDVVISHMVEELEMHKKEILKSHNPSNIISDIISKHVPNENFRLSGLLIDDLSLGYPRTDVFVHERGVTAFQIIKWAVYERLNCAADQWHEKNDAKWRESTKHDHDHYIRSYN